MTYIHLTAHERYRIAHMHMAKFSIRKIASRLNRSPSTISREVRRNKGILSPYWYDWAQQNADKRKTKPRHAKRRNHPSLFQGVIHFGYNKAYPPRLFPTGYSESIEPQKCV